MAEIRAYSQSKADEVAEILANAYLTNPLHLVIFGGAGPEQLRQHRTLFAVSLEHLNTGTKVVAVDNGQIVGFAHWIRYPGCRPSPDAMGAAAPKLIATLDNDVLSKVIIWRRAWSEQDPDMPHSHFGPFAVHPDAQGTGLGRLLMQHYCAFVDRAGETAYLETERPENLAIYRKAGFEVTAERDVLGLPSWFMTRRPREHVG